MGLDISPKTEARLVSKAQERGLSIDALLECLLNDAEGLSVSLTGDKTSDLLVWQLGLRGSLHRRDIYD
jgi:hypothetical protein